MLPTEYIESLIRQDQQRVEQERLEKLLIKGLDSGTPITIENPDEYFTRKKQALLNRGQPRTPAVT